MRLCRLMCGRPVAFREMRLKNSGLRPDFRAQPHYRGSVDGSAERFRTSDGGAVTLRLIFEARPSTTCCSLSDVEECNGAIQLGRDARRARARAAEPALHLRQADDNGENISQEGLLCSNP